MCLAIANFTCTYYSFLSLCYILNNTVLHKQCIDCLCMYELFMNTCMINIHLWNVCMIVYVYTSFMYETL